MVTTARNRFGSVYPYLVCSGRAKRKTDCLRQAMTIDLVEQLIEDEYRSIALSPECRTSLNLRMLASLSVRMVRALRTPPSACSAAFVLS